MIGAIGIKEGEIMYFTRKVTDDLTWVGADDRRLACFEGVYGVPEGVSYNSYLLQDDKTVLFDTVDKAVYQTFFENVKHALNGRSLDYLVIHHMEPDHAYTIEALLIRYPEVKILCNSKIQQMLGQFFDLDLHNADVSFRRRCDIIFRIINEIRFINNFAQKRKT